MTMDELKDFLLWNTVINYCILLIWFTAFSVAHGFVYRMHTRWFQLSVQNFDAINYLGVAIYKIGIILFNVVPLLALWLLS